MSIPFGSSIDLNLLEIQNASFQKLAAAPTPFLARFYFDTLLNKFGVYNGTTWVYLEPGSTTNVSKTTNALAASTLQVSGGLDKTLVDFVSAGGLVKVSPTGVVTVAIPGTDYVTADSTNALTNKTFDANATGNSITNLEVADFATGVVTSTINGSSTATQIPTALSVNTAIAAAVSGQAKPMGGFDASTNPNYPAGNVGEFYRVTVAGLIGGASGVAVEVGDEIHCYVTGIAGTQAAVGSNWTIVNKNLDQATTTVGGTVILANVSETETRTDAIKAVTPANLINFSVKKPFTIGDGIASTFTLTHELNSFDVTPSVRYAATNQGILVEYINTSANITTLSFGFVPTVGQFKVVID